jgi:hypothetical protein
MHIEEYFRYILNLNPNIPKSCLKLQRVTLQLESYSPLWNSRNKIVQTSKLFLFHFLRV